MFFFGHLQVKWRLPPAIHISATAVPRSTDPFQPPKHPSQLDWTSLGQRTESRIRDHPSCSLPRKPGARRSLSNETMYHWQGIDDDHSYCIYMYVIVCVNLTLTKSLYIYYKTRMCLLLLLISLLYHYDCVQLWSSYFERWSMDRGAPCPSDFSMSSQESLVWTWLSNQCWYDSITILTIITSITILTIMTSTTTITLVPTYY